MRMPYSDFAKLLAIGSAECERRSYGPEANSNDNKPNPGVVLISLDGELKTAIEPNSFMYFACGEESMAFVDNKMIPTEIVCDMTR